MESFETELPGVRLAAGKVLQGEGLRTSFWQSRINSGILRHPMSELVASVGAVAVKAWMVICEVPGRRGLKTTRSHHLHSSLPVLELFPD